MTSFMPGTADAARGRDLPGSKTADRSGPTLARVLGDLGPILLPQVAGTPRTDLAVGGVVIHDDADDSIHPPRSIVLGVGVSSREEVRRLVTHLAAQDALALVIRLPFEPDPVLVEELERARLVLLGLPPGATWHQLTTVLGVALADTGGHHGPGAVDQMGGFAVGDLFGMAGAICELVDAPITIEDRNSVVLAYSERQDEADSIRFEVILGRKTPDLYRREDEQRGATRAIRDSVRPVYLPPLDLDTGQTTKGRVAVSVRAGDEVLGTIWAVVDAPLSPEKDQLLLDASRVVAVHMLQLRAGADAAQRLRTDLLATVLEGGPEARPALERLSLTGHPILVVAMTIQEPAGDTGSVTRSAVRTAELQRLAAAFQLHLSGTWADAVVGVLDETIYALVPARRRGDTEINLEILCRGFLRRRAEATPLLIGIGRIAEDIAALELSRRDADRALRVMRVSRQEGGDLGAVTRAVDVEIQSLILELRDLVEVTQRGPVGAYARLLEYDAERSSTIMIDTLRAWLDAHGNVIAAAEAAHVHQNTFRYRLKRMGEIGDFNLEDAEARFALQLQLRLHPPTRPPG
ncbi:MAG: helix-turn-helix domain-containing protein [Nocardioides sp.]|uniref:PucR family transcriptional regulator n=1 Tax=Nocardioides sp. TaxID=35761 RepID=UPI0039E29EF7